MRFLLSALVALCTTSSAIASCVVTPLDQSLKSAKTVFVATITEAKLVTPVEELQDGRGTQLRQGFSVEYKFNVRETFKGNPTEIPALSSSHYYHDYREEPWRMPEDGPIAVGDNYLIISDGPGTVNLSLCSPSKRLESKLTVDLDKLRGDGAKL